MNDELNKRLDSLGEGRVPPVDGAFANRLEADLRASAFEPKSKRFNLGWLFRPGVLVAAAVAVIGGIFVASIDSDPQLQMTAAQGTTVSIPGSTTFQSGAAGLALPDGTRIDVGPDGSAIVAGVVLEADSSALVVDGGVEITNTGAPLAPPDTNAPQAPPSTRANPATTPPTRAPSPTTSQPSSDNTEPVATPTTETPVPRPTSTTVVRDTPAPTTSIAPVRTTLPPPPTTALAPPPVTQPPPPTIEPTPLIISIEMGPIRNRQSTIRWNVEGDTEAIAGWTVSTKQGDSRSILANLRQPRARRLRVAITARPIQFRVSARSADGSVLATSDWVRPPRRDG
ncbi:MAG: hypothetical protein V3V01_05405 [Acidimicrobiales bacterium]